MYVVVVHCPRGRVPDSTARRSRLAAARFSFAQPDLPRDRAFHQRHRLRL